MVNHIGNYDVHLKMRLSSDRILPHWSLCQTCGEFTRRITSLDTTQKASRTWWGSAQAAQSKPTTALPPCPLWKLTLRKLPAEKVTRHISTAATLTLIKPRGPLLEGLTRMIISMTWGQTLSNRSQPLTSMHPWWVSLRPSPLDPLLNKLITTHMPTYLVTCKYILIYIYTRCVKDGNSCNHRWAILGDFPYHPISVHMCVNWPDIDELKWRWFLWYCS